MTPLPQDILLRVERVQDYHRASKYNSNQPKRTNQAEAAIPSTIFKSAPKVALETMLLDASAPAVAVIESGREALPDSQMSPPQDLKTLSTWLFMSDGLNPIRRNKKVIGYQRTCPSSEETAPCEIYIVALAIDGLEPGLYHLDSREYALRKLRDGPSGIVVAETWPARSGIYQDHAGRDPGFDRLCAVRIAVWIAGLSRCDERRRTTHGELRDLWKCTRRPDHHPHENDRKHDTRIDRRAARRELRRCRIGAGDDHLGRPGRKTIPTSRRARRPPCRTDCSAASSKIGATVSADSGNTKRLRRAWRCGSGESAPAID